MQYDVIVVGAGHAGIEAACAVSGMGFRALLVTMSADAIGRMSCNPAVGGVGKGQLVKEIDALGGVMAKVTDSSALQFRVLNASKGQAVRSSRAQVDMYAYSLAMRELIRSRENIAVREGQVKHLILREGIAYGVVMDNGDEIESRVVVLTPGTFIDGVIHVGLRHFSAGRIDEGASVGLGDGLRAAGFDLLRFKTGTCPRLDKETIDFSGLIVQQGDEPPRPFSFSSPAPVRPQLPCYITYTSPETHAIIRNNLDRSPLYAGVIKATGVRYCPSIEDKVVRFGDRDRHQIFLEPEGRESNRIYPNGLSTSLPEDVQELMIHSIPGLQNARIIRYGYGIEHTVVEPTQLFPTLETKLVRNLYCAGQINGTTGYEEAAAQGLVAGINAGLRLRGKEPLVFDRASSYIGVLIDDLTTKGTREPYRMFTSRVEYRLVVREDNADVRLGKIGHDVGLVDDDRHRSLQDKIAAISSGIDVLKSTRVRPSARINEALAAIKSSPLRKAVTLEELLKRTEITLEHLKAFDLVNGAIADCARDQVEIEVKYSGFIERQMKDIERFRNLECIRIPQGIQYASISGVSREIQEKLSVYKPINLGQASRISGVTPVAISLLMVYLKKHDR